MKGKGLSMRSWSCTFPGWRHLIYSRFDWNIFSISRKGRRIHHRTLSWNWEEPHNLVFAITPKVSTLLIIFLPVPNNRGRHPKLQTKSPVLASASVSLHIAILDLPKHFEHRTKLFIWTLFNTQNRSSFIARHFVSIIEILLTDENYHPSEPLIRLSTHTQMSSRQTIRRHILLSLHD